MGCKPPSRSWQRKQRPSQCGVVAEVASAAGLHPAHPQAVDTKSSTSQRPFTALSRPPIPASASTTLGLFSSSAIPSFVSIAIVFIPSRIHHHCQNRFAIYFSLHTPSTNLYFFFSFSIAPGKATRARTSSLGSCPVVPHTPRSHAGTRQRQPPPKTGWRPKVSKASPHFRQQNSSDPHWTALLPPSPRWPVAKSTLAAPLPLQLAGPHHMDKHTDKLHISGSKG